MNAILAPLLEDRYCRAANRDEFFEKRDRERIDSQFSPREMPPLGEPKKSCTTNLFFGFFFDGTKNNYVKAEVGKNHSNVARLYDCYPGRSVPGVLPKSTDWKKDPHLYQHFFKVYAPGVSSPFPQVRDRADWLDEPTGAAGGRMGERRILWSLVQAINNVHRYFLDTPLIIQPEVEDLFSLIVLKKETRGYMTGELRRVTSSTGYKGIPLIYMARKLFEGLLRRLHKAVAPHWPDRKTGRPPKISPAIVQTIYVSIFGFSRGATQARAFANWLQSLCRLDAQLTGRSGNMSLGGFPIHFDFLGLFDTVAAIGLGNTLGGSTGHGAWADCEDSLRVAPSIPCVHLVAAHEIRRSFPVDSISVGGVLSSAHQEIVIPGVHSDIGCGYCPTEQGRGTHPEGTDMLSRIPLLMMYKAARLNGVPLKLELADPWAQRKFAVSAKTILDFNAYIATCHVKTGALHQIMRDQARKQIEWRVWRRTSGKNSLQSSGCYARASTFDQNDLYSAALEFEDEIKRFCDWMSSKGTNVFPVQPIGFRNDHESEWQEIASWWKDAFAPAKPVVDFFDNYVHDSRAWFKLFPGNPDDENKARAQLDGWKARRVLGQTNSPLPKVPGKADFTVISDRLSPAQRKAVDEYTRTNKLPTMITAGREPWDSLMGWLAGAGYLRYRKIYGGDDAILLSSNEMQSGDSSIESGIEQQPPKSALS